LDIDELSEILGVTKATIYSWTSQNKIPHIKLSKRLLKFREGEIREWINMKSIQAEVSPVVRKNNRFKSSDDYIERIITNAKEEVLN